MANDSSQEAIQAKCFHPSGMFVPFERAEIEQSIPERFEKIVGKYPGRVAVRTGSTAVTYEALNKIANQIAWAILAKRGSRPEPIVLLLEHGAPMIAAILAALKAGKIYVPLDSSLPPVRVADILEDSQAEMIVTNNENLALAGKVAGHERGLLNIDKIGSGPSDSPDLSTSPDALADVLYTSGSTGKPKGVVHNHRNVLHDCMVYTNHSHFCADDRLTLLHSCGFGAAKHYLFGALLNGAAIYPFDIKREGLAHLAEWLSQEKITAYHSGVVVYRYFLDTLTGEERFPDLRLIKLGSQQVFKRDWEAYKKYFSPECVLVNALSSTEASTVRWYLMDKRTEIHGDMVPVGYPVEDMETLLLDDEGKITLRQEGEIAIRSPYLALGYWRDPHLSSATFQDSEDGTARIYRTGDLGLMAADGCLTHLGRKDLQVKVRGYRINVGEIETALVALDSIKEAAVTARDDSLGEKRLVAYVVPAGEPVPAISTIRRAVAMKLPDYMVPSCFVMLNALPLTPNGKVDRRALPAPGRTRPEVENPFVAASSPVEQSLAKIWAEVLGLDEVGIHDDFLDLGGHSLLGAKLISRICDAFHMELSLRNLFETRTIACLAQRIQESPRTEPISPLPLLPVRKDGKLLLSFSQQRLWFLDQLEPGSFVYNLCFVFQFAGPLNVTALEQSFNEVIRRHEALRTVFQALNGQPLQIILPSMTINISVMDLSEMVSDGERDSEVRRLATAEAQRPFDLARGPLLRVTLLRLTQDAYVLLLAIHHIIFDGWSIGILARELSALYSAFCSGSPSPLPELPIQYADFAQWQRKWLEEEALNHHLGYWKKQLEDVPKLQLPTDRPRPPVQTVRGARQYFLFPNTLLAQLKSLSNRHGVTLFMTLLAAYQALMHRYTGQNGIAIGSPVAGRNRSELEGLIGFFLNMLVLRTDLSGNPTFGELLARVREVCLEAYAHQDLPFEKLVEELRPERNLSYNPLFQITFALQNTPIFPLELAGLTTKDLEVDAGISRFDLHLFMTEEESGLRGYVTYNTDMFDASTIDRMIGHLQVILQAMVAHPGEQIAIVPLFDRRRATPAASRVE